MKNQENKQEKEIKSVLISDTGPEIKYFHPEKGEFLVIFDEEFDPEKPYLCDGIHYSTEEKAVRGFEARVDRGEISE